VFTTCTTQKCIKKIVYRNISKHFDYTVLTTIRHFSDFNSLYIIYNKINLRPLRNFKNVSIHIYLQFIFLYISVSMKVFDNSYNFKVFFNFSQQIENIIKIVMAVIKNILMH